MKPHFFAAYSRIGIVNKPFRSRDLNIGVESAPDDILSKGFLMKLEGYKLNKYKFPTIRNTKSYQKVLAKELINFKEFIKSKIRPGEMQIVIGGDHSVSFSSIAAVLDRYNPKDVGYVQFDSHGDANTFKSSPSGNFHGMFLRPFLDSFDSEEIRAVVKKKLVDRNVIFVGDLELQRAETLLFKQVGIRNINSTQFRKSREKTLSVLRNFVAQFKHVHVSFDVDVFQKSLVSATGTPSKKGFKKEEILSILDLICAAKSLTFDLVEVNSKKPNSQKTVNIAQEILEIVLIRRSLCP